MKRQFRVITIALLLAVVAIGIYVQSGTDELVDEDNGQTLVENQRSNATAIQTATPRATTTAAPPATPTTPPTNNNRAAAPNTAEIAADTAPELNPTAETNDITCPTEATLWRPGDPIQSGGIYCIPAELYSASVTITADNVSFYAQGSVIFDGGGEPPPTCGSGQLSTEPPPFGFRIDADNVLIAGDITIRGYKIGVMDRSTSGRVTLDGLTVIDNGYSNEGEPDGHGIMISGNITIRNTLVQDNGNDQIRNISDREIVNVLIEDSILAVLRRGPDGDEFNACRHTDGLQIYLRNENITIRRVWCQGLTQCIILGDTIADVPYPAENIFIEDVTVVGSSGIGILGKVGSNWTIQNTTLYCGPNGFTGSCLSVESINDVTFSNNIVVGSHIWVPENTAGAANCVWQITERRGSINEQSADPRFTAVGTFDSFAGWDMRPLNASCADKGSKLYQPPRVIN